MNSVQDQSNELWLPPGRGNVHRPHPCSAFSARIFGLVSQSDAFYAIALIEFFYLDELVSHNCRLASDLPQLYKNLIKNA